MPFVKQTYLSLCLSSLFRGSFSGSSFDFWASWGLLLMRNRFSGMGGISSGRTVDVTNSSCSFSSALSASDLGKHCSSENKTLGTVYTADSENKWRYLFFSFFFCFFFSFFTFFFLFLDSFSDSSESEEDADELAESVELLLELEEARSFFFPSFFAANI